MLTLHAGRSKSIEEKPVRTRPWRNLALMCLLGVPWQIEAQDNKALYPSMAPVEQYMIDHNAEIVLARSAAPESISRDADVLVLGPKGYETAVKGKNGFVCMVARSWMSPFGSPEFWNPKIRAPECYNPPAVESFLPYAFKATGMALSGFSKSQIFDGIKAAVDKKELGVPAPGSLIYMMSKQAYFTDKDNRVFCHLMYDLPRIDGAAWGANQVGASGLFDGSPIYYQQLDPAPITEFYVALSTCSDGGSVDSDGHSTDHSHTH
jgi:hypothetical protein